MSWRRQSTIVSVDADLDDFTEDQLLQGLIDANWLTEDEALVISTRAATKAKTPLQYGGHQADDLYEASRCLRAGRRSEALIFLERFLGRDWIGMLQ